MTKSRIIKKKTSLINRWKSVAVKSVRHVSPNGLLGAHVAGDAEGETEGGLGIALAKGEVKLCQSHLRNV